MRNLAQNGIKSVYGILTQTLKFTKLKIMKKEFNKKIKTKYGEIKWEIEYAFANTLYRKLLYLV
jgi:hypothetical protein